jgi:GAF domain-containing protein
MYDPRIVAKFIEMHADEEPEPEATQMSPALSAIVQTVQSEAARRRSNRMPGLDLRVVATMCEFVEAIARKGPAALADRLHSTLAQIMPATSTVVFGYDATSDQLVAQHASGRHPLELHTLVIPLGQRISGWVAAQRSTIVNSDAALDLGSLAMQLNPPLRSCVSTTLCVGDQLVGVVTVYSTEVDAFDDSHVGLLEVLAARIAYPMQEATLCSQSRMRWETGSPEIRVQ